MKKITAFLIASCFTTVFAQDYHLSNYDMSVQYLNPALTGMLKEENVNIRVNANYRNQWAALNGDPFRTFLIGADVPFNRYGFGMYLLNNHAGKNSLNTNGVMFSGSYQIMNNTQQHSLSTGLQMGMLNKNLNPPNYTYDQQYSPAAGGIDPSLPSGENFQSERLWKFDAAFGIFYQMTDETKKAKPFGGLSIYHITRPNESFTVQKRLPMRITLHGGCDIKVDEKLDLTPMFLLMQQAKVSNFDLNLFASYLLKDDYKALAGLGWRNKDALIVSAGIKYKVNTFRISYDINTSSPLKTYNSGKGAIEFGIIYMGIVEKLKSRSQI